MPTEPTLSTTAASFLDRRKALALLGTGGIAAAAQAVGAPAHGQVAPATPPAMAFVFQQVAALRADQSLPVGAIVQTLGYHAAGDGGAAMYEIGNPRDGQPANDGDVIALANGRHAFLRHRGPVNYSMFGVVGDGKNDDGVQIQRAHQYANRHQLPVDHRGGEYWIIQTVNIPIQTSVEWGGTIFHINEQYNQKKHPRFQITSKHKTQAIQLSDKEKAALLKQLRPGVQIIPELAPYKNHLVSIVDSQDKIGFRAGDRYKGQSWSREEFFYIEEGGRIVGDIAWTFKDYTSLTATPCDESFLVVNGGGFYLSGDNPGEKYTGYYRNGFSITRSRTIICNQWMGLEPEAVDSSLEPRSGFYTFSRVFNILLENVRLIPWEQNRSDPARKVGAGTYGISAARMLNGTFRNVTAEGNWVHWGVFGTNLNKNFRIEKCRLNRIDVHFHCWNLTVQDSVVGLRGISITGGGDLIIENTVSHGNTIVNFRRDFGAKWDGDIYLRNCKVFPSRDREVALLLSSPSNFDYHYPLGCGRTVHIENVVVDFHAFPESTAPVWLMQVAAFSQTSDGARLFFAHQFSARNIMVAGREQGVRLLRIDDPYQYDVGKNGGFDGVELIPTCLMTFENISLEKLPPGAPGDRNNVHLRIGGAQAGEYTDARALYPHIRVTNCPNFSAFLGGAALNLTVEDCTIDRMTASVGAPLRGGLAFNDCRFAPNVSAGNEPIYALEAALGTRFTNCTAHAPRIDGKAALESADRLDFVQPNRRVRFAQLNTTLGNELLKFFQEQEIELSPAFIAMLKNHHPLEAEEVA